jgi:hypothetical protein
MRLALLALTLFALQLTDGSAQQPFAYTRELDAACRKAAHLRIGPEGISTAQADLLADTYFQVYFGLCGGPERPQQHVHYWSVPILVGYAGARVGAIRIDRFTGATSYPGKPTVYPKDFPHALSREYPHR